MKSWLRWGMCLVVLVLFANASRNAAAQENPAWALSDSRLRSIRLDHSDTESFLGICADTTGRLFVGGREALFVYDTDDKGNLLPRKELLRLPPDSWIYDIQIRGDDVYLLTVSALYVAPNARVQREGLTVKRLIWGVPMGHVHQCFHGMTWGPDGYLYFTMGDPLWYYGDFSRPDHWGHWTFFSQPEGTRTPYNGVGGAFRCLPDGSDFQIVARGLRNSCGLTFDADWNLFTNDNDHEGMPEGYVPGRLLHVTPHSYFSWPRGWMVFKTPQRADLLQTMYDEMGRGVPVGQTYYGDKLLPDEYENNLLVARWGRRTVSRFPLLPRGASFRTHEDVLLQGEDIARPVHVAVGRGGRLFVSIAHMPQNEGSPVYPSDLVMIEPIQPGSDPEFYDAVTVEPDRLWSELSSPAWHRRLRAHVEILRRGGELLYESCQRLREIDPNDPASRHYPWLAAVSRDPECLDQVKQVAVKSSDSIRLQAIRALATFAPDRYADVMEQALSDPLPPVQLAALAAFFDPKTPLPSAKVAQLARSQDTYLRQTAALLLANRCPHSELQALCAADDTAGRLAGVLAAGFRLTLPPAIGKLPDELPLAELRGESAYIIQYADAKVDLRDHGRLGNYTIADHWNAGLDHTSEQEALFQLLASMLDDNDEQVRLQAGHFLSLLRDSRVEPKIAEVIAESEDRKLMAASITSVDTVWLAGPFADHGKAFETVHPPETGAINLSDSYSSSRGKVEWKTVRRQDYSSRFYNLGLVHGPQDDASYYAYFRLESPKRQPALLLIGSDDGLKVWQNGNVVWTNDVQRGALPFQDAVKIQLEPGSNDILVRVHNRKGEYGFYLHYRAMSDVKYTLPEKLDFAGLAERLKSAGSEATVPAEFLEVDWEKSLAQGDKHRGRLLFSADGLGCAKCHGLQEEQAGNNGPSLADAAKRFTLPYLVESVLMPSKKISPVFKATLIATVDGEQVTGLVVGETADKVELLLPDTKRRTIFKSEIEKRRLLEQSPMPHGLVKKPQELRDLLSYLLDPDS